MPEEPKRPLKVFLCHIIPLWDAHADRDSVRGLYPRLTKGVIAETKTTSTVNCMNQTRIL